MLAVRHQQLATIGTFRGPHTGCANRSFLTIALTAALRVIGLCSKYSSLFERKKYYLFDVSVGVLTPDELVSYENFLHFSVVPHLLRPSNSHLYRYSVHINLPLGSITSAIVTLSITPADHRVWFNVVIFPPSLK